MLIRAKDARGLQLFKKETPTQMFSCEIYNISKKTNFYRKFPMTASESIISKSLIALSKNFVVRNFAKIKRNPLNFAKFLLTPFYRTPLDDCSGPLDNSKG